MTIARTNATSTSEEDSIHCNDCENKCNKYKFECDSDSKYNVQVDSDKDQDRDKGKMQLLALRKKCERRLLCKRSFLDAIAIVGSCGRIDCQWKWP